MGFDARSALSFFRAMLKTYKSKLKALRILVDVNGVITPVEFIKDIVLPKCGYWGCSFKTDNADMQAALEKHEWFGRIAEPNFWTDDVVTEAPKAKKAKKQVE